MAKMYVSLLKGSQLIDLKNKAPLLANFKQRGTVAFVFVLGILVICFYFYGASVRAKETLWTVSNLTNISSGNDHTCALASGTAYCWGDNSNGQLGDNTTINSPFPVAVNASGALAGKTVTDITAGEKYTCAVASGAAYCWGFGGAGVLGNNGTSESHIPVAVDTSGVLAGKTVTAIAANEGGHTCAVASGAAYCWGRNLHGQLGNNSGFGTSVPVAVDISGVLAGKTVTDIAVGVHHTCAVASDAAYCWGYNVFGQLGDNSVTTSAIPVAVSTSGVLAGKTVTAIDIGAYHTCAVASDAAYCWGYNFYGQLGNNSTTSSSVPVTVSTSGVLASKTVVDIAAGGYSTCAVASDAAYCWGYNIFNQLGDGSSLNSYIPVAVDTSGVLSGQTVTVIDIGSSWHTCAVASGSASCWGYSPDGALGDDSYDSTSTPMAVKYVSFHTQSAHRFFSNVNDVQPGVAMANTDQPVTLSSPGDAFRLRTGLKAELHLADEFTLLRAGSSDFSCGLSTARIYCWGENFSGQLGNGSDVDSSLPTPVTMDGALSGKVVTAIANGYGFSCVMASSAPYCWGNNYSGMLGDGTTTDSTVPVAVDTSGVLAGKTITEITLGDEHACVMASGAPYCWGANYSGTLGDGTTTDSTIPVAVDTSGVLAGKTITEIKAGGSHTCVIADGDVYCWGANWDGQLGNNAPEDSSVPVAVDVSGVLAGKTATILMQGDYHSCVVADGAPYCWGYNNSGQLGNNTTVSSSVPVAVDVSGVLAGKTITLTEAGYAHSCVFASGAPYCWGANYYGQLGNNTTVSSSVPVAVDVSGVLAGKTITSISAGSGFVCVLADSAPYCWGDNYNGQLGTGTTANASQPVAVVTYISKPLQKGYMFKLRYAQKTAATCQAQFTGFFDVSATSAIAWQVNSNVVNGEAITANVDDPTDSADTTYQTYVSDGVTFTNVNSVPAAKYALWDFSLKDNTGLADTSYCLKIVYADGTTMDQYSSYPEIKTAPASIAIGFVDVNGQPAINPSFLLQQKYLLPTCQTSTGTLGSVTGTRLRISQGSGVANGWNVSIAPINGSLSLWDRSDAGASYDFNDSSGSPAGCNSGLDGDGLAGQLTFGLGSTTIAPEGGCSTNGLSAGNTDVSFVDSEVDAVTLLTASSAAEDNCYWDMYGMGISQTIPADQQAGEYDLTLTATVVAQ